MGVHESGISRVPLLDIVWICLGNSHLQRNLEFRIQAFGVVGSRNSGVWPGALGLAKHIMSQARHTGMDLSGTKGGLRIVGGQPHKRQVSCLWCQASQSLSNQYSCDAADMWFRV